MKTAIIVRDKDQMIEVDRVLEIGGIDLGYLTTNGHLRIIERDAAFHAGNLDLYESIHYVLSKGYTFMTADEFLETPGLLDGWGKSAKKNVPMQEIAEKFGVNVENLKIKGE